LRSCFPPLDAFVPIKTIEQQSMLCIHHRLREGFKQFSNGSQFSAWLGLTPRQNSSGGKNNLGSITKRGDMYVRMLLIQGAKSTVMNAYRRDDPISKWAHQLREKSGWQKAVVALAVHG
jgi:transposase